MKPSYWLNKWETKDTKFHQDKVHPQLIKYSDTLPQGKVLVPLCGKTLDMLWLRTKGHHIVGVELSSIACESFFAENNIPYTYENRDEWRVYSSEGIEIWCGDFFHLPSTVWDGITALYDRAALIALPFEYRQKYAHEIIDKIKLLSIQHLDMLLITIDYPQEETKGPPFSVSEDEVARHYQEAFKIQRLEHYPESVLSGHHPHFLNVQAWESVFLLTYQAQERS